MQLKEHQKKGTSSFHGKLVMMFWQDKNLGALLISFWNMNFNTLEQKKIVLMNTAMRDDNYSHDYPFFFVTVKKAYRPGDG